MERATQKTASTSAGVATLAKIEPAEMDKLYTETLKTFSQGAIVAGKILEVRSNEVLVDIGYKSEGSIPASEFADLSALEPGDAVDVLLEDIEDEDGMVVLSKEKAEQKITWDKVASKYSEGSVIQGKVSGKVRGGLLVDVDGVEAFLPGSQIDVSPVHNTDAHLGREYDFKVIKISTERRNIVLSRRELIEERLAEKKRTLLAEIKIGQVRKGVAKNITDFGVFVDLDGMDGLLHITDMSWGRINHPSEIVNVGQELEVAILDIDQEKERVSLGLKQRTENPWLTIDDQYPIGGRHRGKIVNVVPYGAFVELVKGVEGLVHVSEISWTKRVVRASDVLDVGQEVDVVVLNINKDEQKIALGIRQTEENPWDSVEQRFPKGSRVSGPVRNFTSYGAFVEMEEGIDGMIHVSDMSWTRKVNHPSEVLKKGQEVGAIVLDVDRGNQRISLGLKQAQDDPWAKIVEQYTVGEIVSGVVTKLAAFGAFVELQEGVDGLVHISQISDDHVSKVRDALEVGQSVKARIVRIDAVDRRIGLSIKAATMPDEEFAEMQQEIAETLKPGEHMVDLAGAFDEALTLGEEYESAEEWHPGDAGESDTAEKSGDADTAEKSGDADTAEDSSDADESGKDDA